LSSKIAPGGNTFGYLSQLEMVHFTNRPEKKLLYWQKVPERRSGAFRFMGLSIEKNFNDHHGATKYTGPQAETSAFSVFVRDLSRMFFFCDKF